MEWNGSAPPALTPVPPAALSVRGGAGPSPPLLYGLSAAGIFGKFAHREKESKVFSYKSEDFSIVFFRFNR